VKVPMKASGELQALLVFICAAAEKYYIPAPTYAKMAPGYESGPDEKEKRGKYVRAVAKPGNVDMEVEVVVPDGAVEGSGYAFDVPVPDQAAYGRRSGMYVPGLVTAHLAADGFQLGVPSVTKVTDEKGRECVRLEFAEGSPVEVQTPGGSVAMVIPGVVWAGLQTGGALTMVQFKLLLKHVRKDMQKFASSSAFGSWNNVWLSVLSTLCDGEILDYVMAKGLMNSAIVLVAALWDRYVKGMSSAVAASHYSVSLWQKLVGKFSSVPLERGDFVRRKAVKGSLKIAQSDAFLERLYDIRLWFSRVLDSLEARGVFAPYGVAQLQRVLPVSRPVGSRVHDVVYRGRALEPLGLPAGASARGLGMRF